MFCAGVSADTYVSGLEREREEVLARLRLLAGGDDPVSLTELLDLFLSHTDATLGTLRRAVEAGDSGTVRRAARKLRGSCGTFGARALAETCFRLETLSDAVLAEEAAQIVGELERDFTCIRLGMETRLRDLQSH